MSDEPKKYHIDGVPVTAQEIIEHAFKLGYQGTGVVQTTWDAVKWLRNRSCVVGQASELEKN